MKWFTVLLLLLLVLVACQSQPTPGSVIREPLIPETTKIPDQATRDALTVFDTTTGVMRFNASTPVLDNLKPNDVLVSEPATAAPYGFLRKVTSVRKEGGEVIVETTQAKLTEAIQQGTLNVEGKLKANQLRQVTPLSEGAYGRAVEDTIGELSPQVDFGDGFKFEAGIDALLETDDDNGKASVHFKGLVKFDVGYKILIDIGFLADLDAVEASLGFYEETTLNVNADAAGTIQKEIEVAHFDFDPVTFFIGPVPVVLFPSTTIVVGVDGKAKVHFDYTFSQSGGFVQGLRWDEDDGWQRINKNGFDVKNEGPNFKGTMDMRGYSRSNLRVMVYGILGPEVALTTGVRLDAAVPRDPFWILSGYVKSDVAFVIDVLGEEERFDEELFNIERQITSGAAKPPIITILNPNPTIDLGFETDLTQFFKLDDDVGASATLSSDKDGSISNRYTFLSDGLRTITLIAHGASGKTAQAFFTVKVINTPPEPPVLLDEANLTVGKGDEFDLNLKDTPYDKNSGKLACSAVRWTVLGTDALVTEEGSSSGCNATAIFSEQGTRTVKATITDPQGLASERTFNITVGAPPAIKSPSISQISVSLDNGAPFPINGTALRDNLLTASISVSNPNNVPISYTWTIINKDPRGGSYALDPLSSGTSLTIKVGQNVAQPESGGSVVICLDGNEAVNEAAFRVEVNVAGRTRIKIFNFSCREVKPN
jgi:hypothetical protein